MFYYSCLKFESQRNFGLIWKSFGPCLMFQIEAVIFFVKFSKKNLSVHVLAKIKPKIGIIMTKLLNL